MPHQIEKNGVNIQSGHKSYAEMGSHKYFVSLQFAILLPLLVILITANLQILQPCQLAIANPLMLALIIYF